MTLIRSIHLWYREGTSDKVYEVDLVQSAADCYLVHFRYGRRGSSLREGTKTESPVTLTEAEKIFDALVAEKKKGGYQEGQSPQGQSDSEKNQPAKKAVKEKLLKIFQETMEGKIREENPWKMSRILWKIGEERLSGAWPALVAYAEKALPEEKYSLAYALMRTGGPDSLPYLETMAAEALKKNQQDLIHITDFARHEFMDENRRKAFFTDTMTIPLTEELRKILHGNADPETRAEAVKGAGQSYPWEWLSTFYLAFHKIASVKAFLIDAISIAPLAPPSFRMIRQVYKIAEFRSDPEMLALLMMRFDTGTHYFRYRYSWAFTPSGYIKDLKKEFEKPDSKVAWSHKTKAWFRRRSWRFLRQLARENGEKYVHTATEILLRYQDSKHRTTVSDKTHHVYVWRERRMVTVQRTYDVYAPWLLLNSILYGNSSRYEYRRNAKAWRCRQGYIPGSPAPESREESFPELWDQHPEQLLRLLKHSRHAGVQEFALRAFRTHPRAKELLTAETAAALLDAGFAPTVQWALEFLEKSFDPASPDIDMLAMLVSHPAELARAFGIRLISAHASGLAGNIRLMKACILNPYAEPAESLPVFWGLSAETNTESAALVAEVTEALVGLKDEESSDRIASNARKTLTTFFTPYLFAVTTGAVFALMRHHTAEVQALGTDIFVLQKISPESLPAGTLSALLRSESALVREAGIRVFSAYSDAALLLQREAVEAFCLSPFPEFRVNIFPVVQRLAGKSPEFAAALAKSLMPWLLRSEQHEGLQRDIAAILIHALGNHLHEIPRNRVVDFLFDDRAPAQSVGLHLLHTQFSGKDFTLRQIVSLANNRNVDVRAWSWKVYHDAPERMKEERDEALRILDSDWEDTRQFSFAFFREHFSDADWTPELLVSVCDSTRPEVQEFGKEMLTAFFKDEFGQQTLLQLSQHPAVNVQKYVTGYLGRYASGHPDMLPRLELYFRTLLSQVNKAGAAKQTVYLFLEKEAMKDKAAAAFVASLLSRQSATQAVQDKADCIRILTRIRAAWPDISTATNIVPPAAWQPQPDRHAV